VNDTLERSKLGRAVTREQLIQGQVRLNNLRHAVQNDHKGLVDAIAERNESVLVSVQGRKQRFQGRLEFTDQLPATVPANIVCVKIRLA
jgi:hypothetical protein